MDRGGALMIERDIEFGVVPTGLAPLRQAQVADPGRKLRGPSSGRSNERGAAEAQPLEQCSWSIVHPRQVPESGRTPLAVSPLSKSIETIMS
jgi:hypothetical protein